MNGHDVGNLNSNIQCIDEILLASSYYRPVSSVLLELIFNLFDDIQIDSSSTFNLSTTNTGIPQGSVLGLVLFAAYNFLIGRLIESFGIKYYGYTNDSYLWHSEVR